HRLGSAAAAESAVAYASAAAGFDGCPVHRAKPPHPRHGSGDPRIPSAAAAAGRLSQRWNRSWLPRTTTGEDPAWLGALTGRLSFQPNGSSAAVRLET